MGILKQFKQIKDNWLIILIIILLLFVMNGINLNSNVLSSSLNVGEETAYYEKSISSDSSRGITSNYIGDFAPQNKDRKITKISSLTTQVESGEFKFQELKLKEIIHNSNAIILNENFNKYENKRKEYFQGTYNIKIDTQQYSNLLIKLKTIGEVKYFNENINDITAQYSNLELNLDTEKTRLIRYQNMFNEAKEIKDKIDLNDRIFNQERTIKYLEKTIKNVDQQIDYSTIYFTIEEKQSVYANIEFVDFSKLVENITNSTNNLFIFLFSIIPWLLGMGIIFYGYKFIKKK